MGRLDRRRRAEIIRHAQALRATGQRAGWPVERIAHHIQAELPEVTPLEAWRLSYGWSRPQVLTGIAGLYEEDGLAPPPINSSMLCHWEHGDYPPGPEYADALARFYRVAPEALGLPTHPSRERVTAAADWYCQPHKVVHTIGAYGAMTADRDGGTHALAAVRESVQLAIDAEGPAGGPHTREQLERAVQYYAFRYSSFPPAQLAAEVHQVRAIIAGMLGRTRTDNERRELRRFAGWLSALLGNLAFHLDDDAAAHIHLSTAAQLGTDVGQNSLICWAIAAQSMVANHQRRHQEALDLARPAYEYADTPLRRAQVLAWAQLRAMANLGPQHASEARRLMAEAQDEMEADPQGDQPGRFGFDAAELNLHLAEATLTIGDHIEARRFAERSIGHTRVGRPGWAAATAVLARAEAALSRPDTASELAMTILETIPAAALRATSRERLALLDAELSTLADPGAVARDLHERLGTLPPPETYDRRSGQPNGP